MNTTYIFGLVPPILVLFLIVEMLRKGQLRERHALWWLAGATGALLFAAFPGLLTYLSTFFGVYVPINFAFFVSLILLFLVGIQHSSELTKLEEKTRILAEEIAILEEEYREQKTRDERPK